MLVGPSSQVIEIVYWPCGCWHSLSSVFFQEQLEGDAYSESAPGIKACLQSLSTLIIAEGIV